MNGLAPLPGVIQTRYWASANLMRHALATATAVLQHWRGSYMYHWRAMCMYHPLFVIVLAVRVGWRLTADGWRSVSQSVSQYVLVSSPLCGHLTRYCFLFKSFGPEFVILSLWGTLYDERASLSLVSHSLVICLFIHLLLSFFLSHIYHIYIHIFYTIHIIYTRPLSPG
jgi:hypothetical protein